MAKIRSFDGMSALVTGASQGIGRLAALARDRKTNPAEVTYLVDSNPNYTNVCVTDCGFCAFYRPPGVEGGYTLSVEQVMEKVGHAVAGGATTVLLQGGHNPALPFSYYLDLVRETRRRYPGVTPHYFTAPAIVQMAAVSGLTLDGVLDQLRGAGQVSLPGGGASVPHSGCTFSCAAPSCFFPSLSQS